MFLNAVILVLQEILEASLLISVLLAVTALRAGLWPITSPWRSLWVLTAIGCGVVGAWVFAVFMAAVSEWFDYAGQEVVNAAFQLATIALLLVIGYCWREPGPESVILRTLNTFCLLLIIVFAITREGSEIILYTQGIMAQPEVLGPVLMGAVVATGIGVSCGILLYFLLRSLTDRLALRVTLILLALFSGNMASQAVLLLTQADWLPYTPQLWDSSVLLPEYSVSGQVLYALVGYEATPSLAQLLGYLAAAMLMLLSPLFRHSWGLDA